MPAETAVPVIGGGVLYSIFLAFTLYQAAERDLIEKVEENVAKCLTSAAVSIDAVEEKGVFQLQSARIEGGDGTQETVTRHDNGIGYVKEEIFSARINAGPFLGFVVGQGPAIVLTGGNIQTYRRNVDSWSGAAGSKSPPRVSKICDCLKEAGLGL